MLLFHVFMWWFTSRVHQRSASQTSQQLRTFIVKHRKLGHMWHSAQCKTPETGQHWSMLNLREFLSSPSAVWQTYWSWTNAVKKLHHPPCAFVWCVFSLQPWKACCERVRAKNALFLLHLKFEASNLFYSAFFIYSLTFPPFLPWLFESTFPWPDEALRMGIFQQSASDCLVLHHSSIILIPCK